jgi:hypothetical protein
LIFPEKGRYYRDKKETADAETNCRMAGERVLTPENAEFLSSVSGGPGRFELVGDLRRGGEGIFSVNSFFPPFEKLLKLHLQPHLNTGI